MSNTQGPKTPMTPEAASRIQSHADKTGTNQEFKGRAQGAAAKPPSGNAKEGGGNKSGKK